MSTRATPEQQLQFLARDVLPVLRAVKAGFAYTITVATNYTDIHEIDVRMTLGDYRRAVRILAELEKL